MKIYVCHSYGRRRGLSEAQCEENVKSSIEIARKLIKKGHNPFIPNLYHYIHAGWKDTLDEEEWGKLVGEWIDSCEAVYCEIPELAISSGCRYEVEKGIQLQKKIYHEIRQVPDAD